MEEAVVIGEGDNSITLEYNGKTYGFTVNVLGWYEPEEMLGKYVALEKDSTRPNIVRIITEFAKLDLAILKKGVVEYKIGTDVQVLTEDALKGIPQAVKKKLVKKIAPSMEEEKAKLKNFESS